MPCTCVGENQMLKHYLELLIFFVTKDYICEEEREIIIKYLSSIEHKNFTPSRFVAVSSQVTWAKLI